MAEGVDDGKHQAQLQASLPHFDHRALQRADAEQRRVGMQLFDVAADRHRFGDDRSVVEFERRDALEGIERGKGLGLVLHAREVDVDGRYRDALFRQEDPHAPRVGREVGIVKPHDPLASRTLPRRTVCAGRDGALGRRDPIVNTNMLNFPRVLAFASGGR